MSWKLEACKANKNGAEISVRTDWALYFVFSVCLCVCILYIFLSLFDWLLLLLLVGKRKLSTHKEVEKEKGKKRRRIGRKWVEKVRTIKQRVKRDNFKGRFYTFLLFLPSLLSLSLSLSRFFFTFSVVYIAIMHLIFSIYLLSKISNLHWNPKPKEFGLVGLDYSLFYIKCINVCMLHILHPAFLFWFLSLPLSVSG